MSDSDGCRLGKSTGDSPTEATPTSVPAITVQHALADVVDTSSHEYTGTAYSRHTSVAKSSCYPTVANSVQANSDQPNETLAGVKDSESVRSTAGVITDSFDLKCPRGMTQINKHVLFELALHTCSSTLTEHIMSYQMERRGWTSAPVSTDQQSQLQVEKIWLAVWTGSQPTGCLGGAVSSKCRNMLA